MWPSLAAGPSHRATGPIAGAPAGNAATAPARHAAPGGGESPRSGVRCRIDCRVW